MRTGRDSEAGTAPAGGVHTGPVWTQADWEVEKGSQVLDQGWTAGPSKFLPNQGFRDSEASPVAELGSGTEELPWAANGLRLK